MSENKTADKNSDISFSKYFVTIWQTLFVGLGAAIAFALTQLYQSRDYPELVAVILSLISLSASLLAAVVGVAGVWGVCRLLKLEGKTLLGVSVAGCFVVFVATYNALDVASSSLIADLAHLNQTVRSKIN